MQTIDSDTHVIETERTWDFMEPGDRKYRPVLVGSRGDSPIEYWIVDGGFWGAARFSDRDFKKLSHLAGRDMEAPRETREMDDIQRRLQHMDELGVDIQVLYPSIFIMAGATRPEVDVAVCRGYNRWLAHIWSQSTDRLPWVCVPPLLSMPDSLDELRWSRERGAVGVFMRGVEGQRLLHDPYFFPLYEEAQRLDLPITVHIGNSNPDMTAMLAQHSEGGGTFWSLRLALVGAFHALVLSGVPERFPRLRFGFIEGASQWIPYVLNDLQRRRPGLCGGVISDILRANRLYVTCQTNEDIAYLTNLIGEGNLLIGTDYGHNDSASELTALRNLRGGGRITPEQYRKITHDNPKTFYGL